MTSLPGIDTVVSRISSIRSNAASLRRVEPQATQSEHGSFSQLLAREQRTIAAGRAQNAIPSLAAASGNPAAAGSATNPGWSGLFASASFAHGLPDGLLEAVAEVESGFNPRAVSPAGAQGLMQFMPATAAEMGVDPFDPESAIDGAARYLERDIARFGSVELAIAAYNAGPSAVARHNGIPPYAETQTYVSKVLDAWGRSND